MQQILIKNFGPIVNRQGVPVSFSKVLVLCGEQGTGKSSVAKLISQFFWLEKALVRRDYTVVEVEQPGFLLKLSSFHNITSYFKNDSYIKFIGSKYEFLYEDQNLKVLERQNIEYVRPQIMYIPAERNLVAVLDDAIKIQNLPKPIAVFLEEYYNALKNIKAPLQLPISGYNVDYNADTNTVWLGDNNFKIKLSEAASGFQSLVPLFLVSRNLLRRVIFHSDSSNSRSEASVVESMQLKERIQEMISKNKDLKDEVLMLMIQELNRSAHNNRLLNIVEELEQNLYPLSQRIVLNELLRINNAVESNQLVLTTHSPYIINYLTLAIKMGMLKKKFNKTKLNDLIEVVPLNSAVVPEDVSIYQLSPDGEIESLKMFNDLPVDDNMLNNALAETNDFFDRLLEKEESLE